MPQQLDLAQLVMTHAHGTQPVVELSFDPVCFVKFFSLILVFLFIPFLSLAKLLSSPQARKSSRRRSLPASYVPPLPTKPFVPLKTRRHFRVSHIGNRTRRDSPSSSSESDDEASKDPVHYTLVWGKIRRGEETEYTGRSAMKGGRERELKRQLAHLSSPPTASPKLKRSVTIATIPNSSSSASFLPSWSSSPAADLFALPLTSFSGATPSVTIFRSTSFSLAKSSRHFNSASPPLVNSLVRHSKRIMSSSTGQN